MTSSSSVTSVTLTFVGDCSLSVSAGSWSIVESEARECALCRFDDGVGNGKGESNVCFGFDRVGVNDIDVDGGKYFCDGS